MFSTFSFPSIHFLPSAHVPSHQCDDPVLSRVNSLLPFLPLKSPRVFLSQKKTVVFFKKNKNVHFYGTL